MTAFLDAVHAGHDLEAAESHLRGVDFEPRALAFSLAAVLLGPKCPAAWRDQARRVLFTGERPYLR